MGSRAIAARPGGDSAQGADARRSEGARLRRCLVVINDRAGGAQGSERWLLALDRRLREAGWDVSVRWVAPDAVADTIHGSREALALVVVGGGDGTIQSAAQALVGTSVPFGILPLGTMNRFARALGVPMRLEDAIEILATGETRPVDVGQVNGRIFLSTCSIGLYPEIVRTRERLRLRHRSWPNLVRWAHDSAVAGWSVLRSWKQIAFRVRLEDSVTVRRAPMILVTNNPLALARRLDRGLLGVYIPPAAALHRVLWSIVLAALGTPARDEPLETRAIRELDLSIHPKVPIALDGEVRRIPPPLRIRSRRGACLVRVPPASTSESA